MSVIATGPGPIATGASQAAHASVTAQLTTAVSAQAALEVRLRDADAALAKAQADARRIDAWNIYQASRQAMTAALQQLSIRPDYLLIDAMELVVLIEQKSLIKGDARSVSIAAASILAKTHRDARMIEWDAVYPQYGLASHKGYATPDHLEALRVHGPSPLHRHSFAPVRESFAWGKWLFVGKPL